MSSVLLNEIYRLNELMGNNKFRVILNEQNLALQLVQRILVNAGPNAVQQAARKGMEKTVQGYIAKANAVSTNFNQGVSSLSTNDIANISSSIVFTKLPTSALLSALGYNFDMISAAENSYTNILISQNQQKKYFQISEDIKSKLTPFQNILGSRITNPSDLELLKRLDLALQIKQIRTLDDIIQTQNPKLYNDIQKAKGIKLSGRELPAKGEGTKPKTLSKGTITVELEKFLGSFIDAVNKGGEDYVEKKLEESLGYIRTLVDKVESGLQVPEETWLELTRSVERNLLAAVDEYAPNWDKFYDDLDQLLKENEVTENDRKTIVDYFKSDKTWKEPYDKSSPIGYQQWNKWQKFYHGTVSERMIRETFGKGGKMSARIASLVKRTLNNYLFGFFRTLREWNEFTQLYGSKKGIWLFYKYGMFVSKVMWPLLGGVIFGFSNFLNKLFEKDPDKKGEEVYLIQEIWDSIRSTFLQSISLEEENYGIDRWLNLLDVKSIEVAVDILTAALPTNFGIDNFFDYLFTAFRSGSGDDKVKEIYKPIDEFINQIKQKKLDPLQEETFEKWCNLVGYKKTNWTKSINNKPPYGTAIVTDKTTKHFEWCEQKTWYVELGNCEGKIKLPGDSSLISSLDSLKKKEEFKQKGKAVGFREFILNQGYSIEGSKWCPTFNVGFTTDGKGWAFSDGEWKEHSEATQMGFETYCEGTTINDLK